jgi:hypothetical protein
MAVMINFLGLQNDYCIVLSSCTSLPEMACCVARVTYIDLKCHTQNVSLYIKFYSYSDNFLLFAEHIRNTTDRCIFEKDIRL